MQSSTWFKKSTLALVAALAFSITPSAQAAWYESINKTSVTVLTVGAFLLYFFTKQESKNPLTVTTAKEKLAGAMDRFKNAQSSEEMTAALKEIGCVILTSADDILIGHKGKEKGLQAEGKVRLEGVEEVTTVREDGGQVVNIIKYKDVPPYGLVGTAFSKLMPAVKGLESVGKIVASFYLLNTLAQRGPHYAFVD